MSTTTPAGPDPARGTTEAQARRLQENVSRMCSCDPLSTPQLFLLKIVLKQFCPEPVLCAVCMHVSSACAASQDDRHVHLLTASSSLSPPNLCVQSGMHDLKCICMPYGEFCEFLQHSSNSCLTQCESIWRASQN